MSKYDWEIGKEPPSIDPHTIVKHDIYQDYIEQYIRTLNKDPRIPSFKLAIIDAFAGGGLYRDDTGLEYQGSPVRILKAIKNTENHLNLGRKKPFVLYSKIFFIEKKKKSFAFLDRYLSKLGYSTNNRTHISKINSEFDKEYLRIANEIFNDFGRNTRTIFILDQYGYVEVPFECIRGIFSILPYAEVILTLSVDALIDYIANPEQETHKAAQLDMFSQQAEPSKKIQSAAKIRNYLDVIGLNIKELQEDKALHKGAFRGVVESKLLEQVLLFSGARFYTPFFLGEAGNHREMWLLHLSNHEEARSVMTSIHWKYGNKHKSLISHYGDCGLDMLGYIGNKNLINSLQLFEDRRHFDFTQKAREKMDIAVLEDIPKLIYNKEFTVRDFYKLIANHTPGSKEDVLKLLKYALQIGEITATGAKNERRTSAIQITDTISSPKQLIIPFIR